MIKKVFFIGNGCIENGIIPLKKLYKDIESLKTKSFLINSEKSPDSMLPLSSLADQERHFFSELFLSSRGALDNKLIPDRQLMALNHLAAFTSTRLELAKRFKNEDLIFNKNTLDILKKEGFFNDDIAIATINWDNALDTLDLNHDNIIYLHGSCKKPMSMIFPTETISEIARNHTIFKDIEPSLLKKINSPLRQKNEFLEIFNLVQKRFSFFPNDSNGLIKLYSVEIQFNDWMKEADKLFFCGINFNSYDSELINSLALFAKNNNVSSKKIVIINTSNNDTKKKQTLSCILHIPEDSIEYRIVPKLLKTLA
ncbi:MAG: hypothetical protein KR126chlam5_00200 [Candidatus Anoxychlamydiales bacterium]|nr:hypothetical protein [Candidatus Anoxychlamydiales bacterium]